jgi:hypothetical protein
MTDIYFDVYKVFLSSYAVDFPAGERITLIFYLEKL